MTTTLINLATVPVPGFEKDFYDWSARHEAKVAAARRRTHPIIFIGDSITHLFEGDPALPDQFGSEIWSRCFPAALNLGFGFDRTQNVLWRLAHGELDGQAPDIAVVMIGTNNLADWGSVPATTPVETVAGIAAICDLLHHAGAKSVLAMAILPRGAAADPLRALIDEANRHIACLPDTRPWLRTLDIGSAFIDADGAIPKHLMADGVHPTTDGYRLWLAALIACGAA